MNSKQKMKMSSNDVISTIRKMIENKDYKNLDFMLELLGFVKIQRNDDIRLTGLTNLFKLINEEKSSDTESVIKPEKNPKSQSEQQRIEKFQSLKNEQLRNKLIESDYVELDSEKYVKVKDLNYRTIFEVEKISKDRWNMYFNNGGKIYIDKNVNGNRISSIILFDKNLCHYITKGYRHTDNNSINNQNSSKSNEIKSDGDIMKDRIDKFYEVPDPY